MVQKSPQLLLSNFFIILFGGILSLCMFAPDSVFQSIKRADSFLPLSPPLCGRLSQQNNLDISLVIVRKPLDLESLWKYTLVDLGVIRVTPFLCEHVK